MTAHPAIQSRSTGTSLALGLVVAGAIAGAALQWVGRAEPIPVDLVRVSLQSGKVLDVQRTEVTVRDWARCHDEGGCSLEIRAPQDGKVYPATGVSFVDAQDYITWINSRSETQFRLPSKAEWYAMADEVLPETPDPIFTAPELRWASAYMVEAPGFDRALHPTGAFSTTSTGVQDLDGNVWEWTRDCYDGDAARTDPARCPAFIMGGLHESVMSYLVRDPANGGCASGLPPAHLGFRLVTDAKTDGAP